MKFPRRPFDFSNLFDSPWPPLFVHNRLDAIIPFEEEINFWNLLQLINLCDWTWKFSAIPKAADIFQPPDAAAQQWFVLINALHMIYLVWLRFLHYLFYASLRLVTLAYNHIASLNYAWKWNCFDFRARVKKISTGGRREVFCVAVRRMWWETCEHV